MVIGLRARSRQAGPYGGWTDGWRTGDRAFVASVRRAGRSVGPAASQGDERSLPQTRAEYLEKIDPLSFRSFQSIFLGGMAERIQRKKGVADGRGSGGTRDFRASLNVIN